jgi:Na+/H+ antiporter NhaA
MKTFLYTLPIIGMLVGILIMYIGFSNNYDKSKILGLEITIFFFLLYLASVNNCN